MGSGVAPGRAELERRLRDEGTSPPRWWSNGPGDSYGRHEHGYHKVLYCAEGTIVFHLESGAIELGAGDRLDIEPGTPHSATVGEAGVTCVEASRPA